MKHELAIIIPAYKEEYLKETLESIAAQTNQNFKLYIGDDASPNNLYAIVKAFESRVQLTYKRFEKNLGGNDLVSHWDRCISMIEDEQWIWLFSDDDIMEPTCVESFYMAKSKDTTANLLHFNIVIINHAANTIKLCNNFPANLSVSDFFSKRINFQINSSVIEYIFNKSVFVAKGGFQNYDLAWCADDATWIKFGTAKGIATIHGPKVSWRYSGSNISSNIQDKGIVIRKINSIVAHLNWVKSYFSENNIVDSTTPFQKLKWALSLIVLTPAFTLHEKYKLTTKLITNLGFRNVRLQAALYLLFRHTKDYLSSIKSVS